MSEQENMKIVRMIYENINSRELEKNDKYLADDFRSEVPGVPNSMNKQQSRENLHQYLEAFPDLRYDLKDIIAQGDKVAVTWVVKGTHKAPLILTNGDKIPATQKKATVSGGTVLEMRNNKVVRQQMHWDMLDLLSQLGVVRMQDIMSRASR